MTEQLTDAHPTWVTTILLALQIYGEKSKRARKSATFLYFRCKISEKDRG